MALLNDCKYGHRVRDGILDLNLLRSATYPDPVADCATHEFTYSLYPHVGDFADGGVVRAGYELNVPLRLVQGDKVPDSLATIEAPGVVIDAVKKAEDSNALIFRLVELHGLQTRTAVRFGFDIHSVAIVDLMEENPKELVVSDSQVEVELRPFEVLTLSIR